MLSDVAEGLLHAAQSRVVHLDVSLTNVMVQPVERGRSALPRAVLIDFGCSRTTPTAALQCPVPRSPMAVPGDYVGNRAHIAPEVHAALLALRERDVVLDFAKQVLRVRVCVCGQVVGGWVLAPWGVGVRG